MICYIKSILWYGIKLYRLHIVSILELFSRNTETDDSDTDNLGIMQCSAGSPCVVWMWYTSHIAMAVPDCSAPTAKNCSTVAEKHDKDNKCCG